MVRQRHLRTTLHSTMRTACIITMTETLLHHSIAVAMDIVGRNIQMIRVPAVIGPMNKIIQWLKPRTTYVWYDVNKKLPTKEGIYLVIRENRGKRGGAHFDLYCLGEGWMQIRNTLVGTVVLWTEAPETPEK